MGDILTKIAAHADQIYAVIFYIMIIATVVVRITPSETDNVKVAKISGFILKVMGYFPTLGKNPRTKKLEKVYGDIAGK